MRMIHSRACAHVISTTAVLLTFLATDAAPTLAAEQATGVVFNDLNRDGIRDPDEPGIPEIGVCNQREVVTTDRDGRWTLPVDEDTILFVIKPSGWMTPVNEHQLPRFFHIHKPNGSPEFRYPGVPPTGPLPASIDFPLHPQNEPERFKAIFFGDPQPRDQKEVDYIAHDVVEELIGTDAKFGVTLGDILFDDLSLFGSLNGTIALIGIPWFNVIGNHDLNFDAATDAHSDETFERVYGPSYYSFDYGAVHFIVLDNIDWIGAENTYRGGLGADQIAFVKNDLALVPEARLVVLMMHIPIRGVADREDLFRLIEDRPYTLSISGHTHWQAHQFITGEDGWRGPEPHHHIVNVTVSGSWWKGAKDERGIPHTTMRDGAPNGYSIITFDGHNATFDFKAARAPGDYQINIHAPEAVAAAETTTALVHVNVFAGSEKSTVSMRIAGGPWIPLTLSAEPDPYYVAVRNRELERYPDAPALNEPIASAHLWKGNLPENVPAGTHLIEVRTRDMYGRVFTADRVIRIE